MDARSRWLQPLEWRENFWTAKMTERKHPRIDGRFACFRLRLGKSGIAGTGVFALEEIPSGLKVIEYTGELLTRQRLRRRAEESLRASGRAQHISIFLFNSYRGLDGDVGGSGAEKVNHSCDPNTAVRKVRGHILYFSKRRIRKGEEVTIDYRLHPAAVRIACRCGAANCRGTINRKA
jgi:SET domain-containing protein